MIQAFPLTSKPNTINKQWSVRIINIAAFGSDEYNQTAIVRKGTGLRTATPPHTQQNKTKRKKKKKRHQINKRVIMWKKGFGSLGSEIKIK